MNTGAPWPSLIEANARVLEIQTKLHQWAGDDEGRRFDDLFNLVCDPAFLVVAWNRVRSNKGANTAGVDGESARYIEHRRGLEAFLDDLRGPLKARTFRPQPVREVRIVRDWRPEVLLTRNPSGALAAFATRTRSVFDTDDGRQAGLHYWLARIPGDVITSSVHDPESHGRAHVRYPGFKALTYLHPDRFRPDPTVRARLGVPEGPLFVVRFGAHDAAHDRHIEGIAPMARAELLTLLSARGTVVLAREGAPTVLLGPGAERTFPPESFHDLLAQADLCVGDSQSVAIEAALLGVPTIRLSGFTGRHFTLQVLEEQYGLVRNFRPGEESELLAAVPAALDDLSAIRGRAEEARERLLADTVDLTGWFIRTLEGLAESVRSA